MHVSKFLPSLVGAGLLSLGAAASANAAVVFPTNTWGGSSYVGYDDVYAIDQGAGSDVSDWASQGEGAGAWLRLDLGDIYKLDQAYVTDRTTSGAANKTGFLGLFDFTTKYSIQGFTDASFTTAIAPALVFDHAAPVNPTQASDFLDIANLGGLTARYVQYNVVATNGVNPGLSDIHFITAAVPEPAAWMLMIVGFGGMGVTLRRRRALAYARI